MWYLAVKYDLLGSKVAFLLSTGKFFVSFEVMLSGSRVPGYITMLCLPSAWDVIGRTYWQLYVVVEK